MAIYDDCIDAAEEYLRNNIEDELREEYPHFDESVLAEVIENPTAQLGDSMYADIEMMLEEWLDRHGDQGEVIARDLAETASDDALGDRVEEARDAVQDSAAQLLCLLRSANFSNAIDAKRASELLKEIDGECVGAALEQIEDEASILLLRFGSRLAETNERGMVVSGTLSADIKNEQ